MNVAKSLQKKTVNFQDGVDVNRADRANANVAAGARGPNDTGVDNSGVTGPVTRSGILRDAIPEKMAKSADKLALGVQTASAIAGAPAASQGSTMFGKMKLEDNDLKFIKKRQELIQKADFYRWFANKYVKMTDIQKKWAREAFPAYFTDAKKEDEHMIKLMKRIRTIARDGVKNKQDLEIKYLLETGKIPTEDFLMIAQPFRTKAIGTTRLNDRNIQRGLFNPRRNLYESGYSQREITANAARLSRNGNAVADPAAVGFLNPSTQVNNRDLPPLSVFGAANLNP